MKVFTDLLLTETPDAVAVTTPEGKVLSQKDVTQLKVLRDAKLVESKFRDLLESTPDAIIMANETGRIVLANSHAETLFG